MRLPPTPRVRFLARSLLALALLTPAAGLRAEEPWEAPAVERAAGSVSGLERSGTAGTARSVRPPTSTSASEARPLTRQVLRTKLESIEPGDWLRRFGRVQRTPVD